TGVLVLSHPTRGVDIGGARAIHEQILACAAQRKVAVLVLSSDLAELRALATRIVVMSRGRIVAEVPPHATDIEIGGKMMADTPTLRSEAP
ncbi:MAG: heme ABC transporter ATP-binding protein, partial [Polyangiaceae bacterium]